MKNGDDLKGKKKGKSKSKNKTLKCFQCHKEGHFKIDCLEIKNQRKKGKDMNGDAAVVFDEQEDDYDSVGILVASSNQIEGKWVLDSGCAYHMCPNKHLFTMNQPYEGGKVMMGNNASYKVTKIGFIRLKIHNGIIRELPNVRHVPELKRNLISLSILNEVGCSIRVKASVLKFF